MLNRFRRGSKVKIDGRNASISSNATSLSTTTTQQQIKRSFFSLPAELRNDIYDLVAAQIQLHLFQPRTQKEKQKLIPGLLLANRQTRNEFLPILLSTASVQATITDFDFTSLTRVAASLYPTELKALRLNPSLTIRLRLKKYSFSATSSLRRWCTNRASSLDRLPWVYALEAETARNPDRMLWYCEKTRALFDKLNDEEGVRAEVQMLLEVLERALGIEAEWDGMRRQWSGGYGESANAMNAMRSPVRGGMTL